MMERLFLWINKVEGWSDIALITRRWKGLSFIGREISDYLQILFRNVLLIMIMESFTALLMTIRRTIHFSSESFCQTKLHTN